MDSIIKYTIINISCLLIFTHVFNDGIQVKENGAKCQISRIFNKKQKYSYNASRNIITIGHQKIYSY